MTEIIKTLAEESTDLALHSKLCAQRYEQIIQKLDTVDARLDRMDVVLTEIKDNLANNEIGQLKTYLVWAGFIIVTLTGLVVYFIKHL
jgi:hypothetical protein